MIIVGAKGFAKEILEVLHQKNELENLYFYDDVSNDAQELLYNCFKILRTKESAIEILKSVDSKFSIGVGNPTLRYSLVKKFTKWGGEFTSIISPKAQIGHYGSNIGTGVNIMTGVIITNDVQIADGVLINLNCTVGHDSIIERFSEISPGVHISGRCRIGSFCNIGTGVVLLPDITLGQNVVVGAGSVVTKDIEKNSLVVGIPGRIIKKLKPIDDEFGEDI